MPLNLILRASPWVAILALLALVGFKNDRIEGLKTSLTACQEGRKADRTSYVAAQAEAGRLNLEQVKQIEARQEAITDDVTRTLNARLELLRHQLRSPATQSPANGSTAGQAGPAIPGPVGEARVCLTPDQLLRAAENEERHDRLIDWVERQASR